MGAKEKNKQSTRDLRKEMVEGLLYAHSRANSNTTKTLETSSFLFALIELLSEEGFIEVEKLDARKRVVGGRLAKQFRDKGMGAVLQDPEYEKYSFNNMVAIDCKNRVHLCKAACCRLPFALSKQDIHEGIVQWDLGQPYMIDQGSDGYCIHLNRCSLSCTIHENRPVPCRAFDCRNDKRIWLDFEKRIPNPEVNHKDWLQRMEQSQGEVRES